MKEESGFEARAVKLAGIWDYRRQGNVSSHPYSIYKVFFVCELTGGEASASLETSAVEFFPRDRIPELSLGRVNPRQIERMYEHWQHPELPAEFD
jgi:ADP-ribose pyrophosphatase YjhB (NUDIX family)